MGDVGQNDIEEVNLVVKGGNYGWPKREGNRCFNPNGNADGFAFNCPPIAGMIDPIAQYDTHHEGHSVIGGSVYRGTALAALGLVGHYIFGEFAAVFNFPSGPHDYGRLLHFQPNGADLHPISEFQIQGTNGLRMAVLGMGQDAAGEIYVGGNPSGLPFGTQGLLLRLAVPDDDP